MAYWGLAYVLGPNYNKPWGFFNDEERKETLRRTRKVMTLGQTKAVTGSWYVNFELQIARAIFERY